MKKLIKIIAAVLGLILAAAVTVNCTVIIKTMPFITTADKAGSDYDCIIIPGSTVYANQPRPILKDRLDCGIALYKKGISDTLLLTGDASDSYYDEVTVMKNYAIENGVPEECIICDEEGLSTYASIYNAKSVFGIKSAVIVTQKYHISRTLFIAKKLRIDACGIPCDRKGADYGYIFYRHSREFLARVKDFVLAVLHPEPASIPEFLK